MKYDFTYDFTYCKLVKCLRNKLQGICLRNPVFFGLNVYFGEPKKLTLPVIFPAFPNVDFLDEMNDLEMDIPDASEIFASLDDDFGHPMLSKVMESMNMGQDCIDAVKNAFSEMPDTVDLASIRSACVTGVQSSFPVMYKVGNVCTTFDGRELETV